MATRRALIVVDCQDDFTEGGALAVQGGKKACSLIAQDIRLTHPFYSVIISTRDWHINPGDHFAEEPDYVDTWPEHCVAFTPGARYDEKVFNALRYVEQDTNTPWIPVQKGQYAAAYSGFEGANVVGVGLQHILDTFDIETVDVAGIAYDYCVKATAMDSALLGYKTIVMKPFTASVNPDNDDATSAEMRSVGVQIHESRIEQPADRP